MAERVTATFNKVEILSTAEKTEVTDHSQTPWIAQIINGLAQNGRDWVYRLLPNERKKNAESGVLDNSQTLTEYVDTKNRRIDSELIKSAQFNLPGFILVGPRKREEVSSESEKKKKSIYLNRNLPLDKLAELLPESEQLQNVIDILQEQEIKVLRNHHWSKLDSMTRMHNRFGFPELVASIIRKHENRDTHKRPKTKVFLIQFDIDFFTSFNELGHPFGDLALKRLARAALALKDQEINAQFKDEDARADAIFDLYRWGGEEFVMLVELPVDSDINPHALAAQLKTNVEREYRNDPGNESETGLFDEVNTLMHDENYAYEACNKHLIEKRRGEFNAYYLNEENLAKAKDEAQKKLTDYSVNEFRIAQTKEELSEKIKIHYNALIASRHAMAGKRLTHVMKTVKDLIASGKKGREIETALQKENITYTPQDDATAETIFAQVEKFLEAERELERDKLIQHSRVLLNVCFAATDEKFNSIKDKVLQKIQTEFSEDITVTLEAAQVRDFQQEMYQFFFYRGRAKELLIKQDLDRTLESVKDLKEGDINKMLQQLGETPGTESLEAKRENLTLLLKQRASVSARNAMNAYVHDEHNVFSRNIYKQHLYTEKYQDIIKRAQDAGIIDPQATVVPATLLKLTYEKIEELKKAGMSETDNNLQLLIAIRNELQIKVGTLTVVAAELQFDSPDNDAAKIPDHYKRELQNKLREIKSIFNVNEYPPEQHEQASTAFIAFNNFLSNSENYSFAELHEHAVNLLRATKKSKNQYTKTERANRLRLIQILNEANNTRAIEVVNHFFGEVEDAKRQGKRDYIHDKSLSMGQIDSEPHYGTPEKLSGIKQKARANTRRVLEERHQPPDYDWPYLYTKKLQLSSIFRKARQDIENILDQRSPQGSYHHIKTSIIRHISLASKRIDRMLRGIETRRLSDQLTGAFNKAALAEMGGLYLSQSKKNFLRFSSEFNFAYLDSIGTTVRSLDREGVIQPGQIDFSGFFALHEMTVTSFDMDRLKILNDGISHDVGDIALQLVNLFFPAKGNDFSGNEQYKEWHKKYQTALSAKYGKSLTMHDFHAIHPQFFREGGEEGVLIIPGLASHESAELVRDLHVAAKKFLRQHLKLDDDDLTKKMKTEAYKQFGTEDDENTKIASEVGGFTSGSVSPTDILWLIDRYHLGNTFDREKIFENMTIQHLAFIAGFIGEICKTTIGRGKALALRDLFEAYEGYQKSNPDAQTTPEGLAQAIVQICAPTKNTES